MASVSLDRLTITHNSSDIVQILIGGFQSDFFSCERVRLEYVEGGINTWLAEITPSKFESCNAAFNWKPGLKLPPGIYPIRAVGTQSGQVAVSPDPLTVVSFTGGGVEGEMLEAYIAPASPAVNQNFDTFALVYNKGSVAGQFYYNAMYIDTAGNPIRLMRSSATGTLIQPGQSLLLSTPLIQASVAGKVIFELRTYPANVTQDLREVTIIPSGGTTSANAVINSATVPAVVNHNTVFGVALTLGETNGISGSVRIRPLIDGILQNPTPPFTITGGITNLRKDITFTFLGPTNRTIGFKVETFINSAWIVTDTEASKPVQVLAPIGPPPIPPPPPCVEQACQEGYVWNPATCSCVLRDGLGLPNIPIEYIIVGGVVAIIAGVLLLPAKARA